MSAENNQAIATSAAVGDRPIRVLPALVVDQIAAGEVVERPASVVKELLDNALDAGATRITIELERGGVELIRVSDNGRGIPREQIHLAVTQHATSKITDAGDLDRVATMGFRGEALPSIASVSRFSIRSRRADDESAWSYSVEGGTRGELAPASGDVGTTVSVRNLFFNTPARRKFLRTDQTEQGHCLDVVRSLALSHPAIGFALKAKDAKGATRTLIDVPPGQGPKDRALALLGKDLESQFVPVHADRMDDRRGLALWGLVGLPTLARPTNKGQHVFVNGRPVRDKTIAHAFREGYRGVIEPGRHPVGVIMIEMDPSAIDVNVHPAKTEVRFRDSGLVHTVVLHAVREALAQHDLTPASGGGNGSSLLTRASGFGEGETARNRESVRKRFVEYFQSAPKQGETTKGFDFEGLKKAVEEEAKALDEEREALARERERLTETTLSTEHLRTGRKPDAPGQESMAAATPNARALSVHNSYLVTQDEGGLVIIDQHALHERVMYEKLKSRVESNDKGLEKQGLLMPAVVETTEKRVALLDDITDLLARLGIEAEPMGPASIAVHAFPSFLFEKNVAPGPFVDDMLELVETEGRSLSTDALLHEVLDMMACKAAVKAGDSLSDSEITELLEMRQRIERASNCPHGRPTQLRISIKELEKEFGRG